MNAEAIHLTALGSSHPHGSAKLFFAECIYSSAYRSVQTKALAPYQRLLARMNTKTLETTPKMSRIWNLSGKERLSAGVVSSFVGSHTISTMFITMPTLSRDGHYGVWTIRDSAPHKASLPANSTRPSGAVVASADIID